MHKGLLISLAAFAAAAPRPLLDLPIVSDLDLPTKDIPLVSDILATVEDLTNLDVLDKDLPVVSDILTEVEDLTHLELPLDLELPEVEKLLQDLEKLIKLELPLELELPEIRSLLSEVEGIVGGELPSVTELLAKVEALIGELLDINALNDLPSVQDLLLEIDSLTEGLKKRGIIVDIENAGIDVLNSQDVVPLENTLSEFNQEATPSASKSSAIPSPSGSGKSFWPSQSSGSDKKGTKYISTFDELEPVLGQVALQQVGPYNGLDYNGIALVELGIIGDIDTGVIPKSAPNAGYYGQFTDLLFGSPNITTEYENSVTDSFDFESFWFGCTKDTVETIVELPLSCNVTVTGYKHKAAVANQTFVFTYNSVVDGTTTNMTQAKLSKAFTGIHTATFESSYDVSSMIGATLIDSLDYTVYTKKDDKSPK